MIQELSIRFAHEFEGEPIPSRDIAGMVQVTGINMDDPEEVELDIYGPDNGSGPARKCISISLADFRRLIGAVQEVEEARARNKKERAS